MPSFELTTSGHVAAPPGKVWAHLVDQDAVPCWLDGVSAVVSDGDALLVRSSEDAGAGWVSGAVVDADPRHRLSLRFDAPGSSLREARVEVTLNPSEAGTTYELRVVGTPSFLGNLLLPVLRLRAEVAMARAVRGFRSAVEDRAARKRRPFEAPCPERNFEDELSASAAS